MIPMTYMFIKFSKAQYIMSRLYLFDTCPNITTLPLIPKENTKKGSDK